MNASEWYRLRDFMARLDTGRETQLSPVRDLSLGHDGEALAAERRKNKAHGASRGCKVASHQAPEGRKKSVRASCCPQNPTNTGSGSSRIPHISSTLCWIISLKATTSPAVASPRFTMASACLREIPTRPNPKPLPKPERSTSHAAETF